MPRPDDQCLLAFQKKRPSSTCSFLSSESRPLSDKGDAAVAFLTQTYASFLNTDDDRVDFNTDQTIAVPLVLKGSIIFRPRRAYHPRVGYTLDEYAAFQEEKFTRWPRDLGEPLSFRLSHWSPEEVVIKSRAWPQGCNKTLGPFTMRPGHYWACTSSVNNQNRLITLLRKKDLADIILSMLFFAGHFNTAYLAASCRAMFSTVAEFSDQWDFCFAEFNNCHLLPKERAHLTQTEIGQIGVGKYLRVINNRAFCADSAAVEPSHFLRPSDRSQRIAWAKFRDRHIDHEYTKRCKRTFPSIVQNRKPDPSSIWKLSYFDQVTNLIHLSTSISQFGSTLRVLQFHRTPILDYRMISVLLKGCPNLDSLGVYKCDMVHYGHVLNLLDVTHDFNTKFDRSGESRLQLDFYPRYHRGPDSDRHATFGLTWLNRHSTPVQQGIYQILMTAILKAEPMGIDLLSKTTAFRKYLEDLPLHLWSVPDFIDATLTYLHWYKRGVGLTQREVLVNDILAVVVRGLELRDIRLKYDNVHLWSESYYCASCGLVMSRVFFDWQEKLRMPNDRTCAGCALRMVLDQEKDHYKRFKKTMMDMALGADSSHHEPHGSVEPPLLDNGLFTHFDSESQHRLARGYTYQRTSMLHEHQLCNLPPLSDMAGSNCNYYRWSEAFIFAFHVDIRDRFDQQVTKIHKDDWATPQPFFEGGTSNQLSWEALRRKKEFDQTSHPPGDHWYLV